MKKSLPLNKSLFSSTREELKKKLYLLTILVKLMMPLLFSLMLEELFKEYLTIMPVLSLKNQINLVLLQVVFSLKLAINLVNLTLRIRNGQPLLKSFLKLWAELIDLPTKMLLRESSLFLINYLKTSTKLLLTKEETNKSELKSTINNLISTQKNLTIYTLTLTTVNTKSTPLSKESF